MQRQWRALRHSLTPKEGAPSHSLQQLQIASIPAKAPSSCRRAGSASAAGPGPAGPGACPRSGAGVRHRANRDTPAAPPAAPPPPPEPVGSKGRGCRAATPPPPGKPGRGAAGGRRSRARRAGPPGSTPAAAAPPPSGPLRRRRRRRRPTGRRRRPPAATGSQPHRAYSVSGQQPSSSPAPKHSSLCCSPLCTTAQTLFCTRHTMHSPLLSQGPQLPPSCGHIPLAERRTR
jgi:hypothetical protein